MSGLSCIFLSILTAFLYGSWGFPLWFVIQLGFLALKLFGHVEWSWWRVLIPLWVYLAALGGIAGFFSLQCVL